MSSTKQWRDLMPLDQIERGDATPASLGTREFAVYDTVDGIFVSLARCTHGAANLCDGYFDGRFIECPLHQGLFDARTGKAKALPARRPLFMIKTRIKDDIVQIFI